ncbi:MAG: 5-formyltetrahydrofolate cyclo-ligase [Desulfobulbaceae bacterium]|nr:5-formyltetrahydrofolate cyclo-ligase [Desulfobulbaceae bacterium]
MNPFSKEQLRELSARPDPALSLAVAGRLAEVLRRLPGYRQAQQLMIDPSPLLKQARINALVDGKVLIMPGPGLKEGFYRLEPYTIKFAQLAKAVSGRDLPEFGKRLASRVEIAGLKIALLIGEAWAVDRRGFFLGEGKGFFDLSVALLAELGGLAEGCRVVMAVADAERLINNLPVDPWDVGCEVLLTAEGEEPLSREGAPSPAIVWEALSLDRIKRITPLWKLYVEQGRDRQG